MIQYLNLVNPELGNILSRTIKIFKNRISNLSNPGQELYANKIHKGNCFFFFKKPTIGHIKMINLYH